MRRPSKEAINLVLGILVIGLLVANVTVASAHDWWHWHFHGTGSDIAVWVHGTHQHEANAALDDWEASSDLQLPRQGSHTEISVFGGDFGSTGWWGLASIEDRSYDWWHYWDYSDIEHCHARYNSYYGGSSHDIRGVFCQEIGHCFGLGHSADGCMGKGYYNVDHPNNVVPHNAQDVNAKY